MKSARIFIVFTFLLAFVVCVSAQANPYPNELRGYEFFGKGKLKDLKLGVSTKEDTKRIFGQDCEYVCQYDENWFVNFDFIDENTTKEIGGKKFIPKKEFIGTLYSITLQPKKNISFQKIKFSKSFALGNGGGSASGSETDEGSWYESKVYEDSSGLIYDICKKSFPDKCKKGELLAIEYTLPKKSEAKLFTLQK